MKLKICSVEDVIPWNSEWIFAGKNFSNLKKLTKKISGNRIKINRFTHKIFDREIKNYLSWTESQRVLNQDSNYWWMTDLAGKNNLNSDFFLFICQIYSILEILKEKKYQEILIVCDDQFLIETINTFLKEKNYKIELIGKKKYFKNLIQKKITIFLKIILAILSTLHWMVLSKFFIKLNNAESGEIILIHQLIDSKIFKKNNKLENRYFPYLKDFLIKRDKKVKHLVWFYNFWFNRIKVLKSINKQSGFIIESYLSLTGLRNALVNFLKTKETILNCSNYNDIKTDYLLERESLNYLSDTFSNLKFWFYNSALRNWSKNYSSLICIDHYENMAFEHALIGSFRDLKIKKKMIYGYHHTLSSKEFTAWQSLSSEWSSKFKPDFVISCGKLSSNLLTTQGVPKERIIDGPALRYHKLISGDDAVKLNKKDYTKILFPLSKIKDSSLELIEKALELGKMLSETNFKLIIKPHPDFRVDQILSKKIKSNNSNIIISEKNIDELLNECGFSVFMATGAAYDAILKGSITLTLRSELNLSDNYLDIFEKEYDTIEPYDLLTLKKLLIKLKNDKNELEKYKVKFFKIRNLLSNGFNKINEERLNLFSNYKNGN